MATTLRLIQGGRSGKPLDEIEQLAADLRKRTLSQYQEQRAKAIAAGGRLAVLRRKLDAQKFLAEQAAQFCAVHGISRSTYFTLLVDTKKSAAQGKVAV